MLDVDVAIVGAGPVGVVLATLLAQGGARVHICDAQSEVYQAPRAIALDHEVLRVFQQVGVVQQVLPHTEAFTPSEFYGAKGQLIRRMTMVAPPFPQGYTPSVVFTQPAVEQVLREHLASLNNVSFALGCKMQSFEQDADGVNLHYSHGPSVRARFAVGCDGASSAVRTGLGIALQDLSFDEAWLVVDLLVNEQGLAKLPKTSVQYCEPSRPCTLVIGPKNHRRWEISLKAGEDPREMEKPENTWALLSRWLTSDDATLWRRASYRFHALVAQPWQQGRVLLAGDAAHQQPPFLGQGLCQGVRDAANLAWKLTTVLKGHAPGAAAQRLLSSYGQERHAHVRELTNRIKGVGAVICERDEAKAHARDEHLLAQCGGVVKDTPRQDILPALTVGCLYPSPGAGSLFVQPRLQVPVEPHPTPASATQVNTVSEALMDELHGHGWRWVSNGDLPLPELEGVARVNLALQPETQGVATAWLARHGACMALLRPDHYVFGTARDTSSLHALVAAWQRLGLSFKDPGA